MICDICAKKKATVHLTEIVDDQMTELHLCEECAREKSVQMEQQFGLADLLAGLSDFGKQVADFDKTKMLCTNCGMSYDDFKKLGRLGCSECYSAFRDSLGILLRKIHGSTRHVGKSPVKLVEVKESKTQTIKELRAQLLHAVQSENYEKAAELRDQIRTLEKEGKDKS